MTYSTPELQRVGGAQNIVLGIPKVYDNCDSFNLYTSEPNTVRDGGEW
jgi:hypothetical protein